MPTYQISALYLVIYEGSFLKSKETGEWKRTLALSSVEVKNSLDFISSLQKDSTVCCLIMQDGNFVLSQQQISNKIYH